MNVLHLQLGLLTVHVVVIDMSVSKVCDALVFPAQALQGV